MKSLKVAALVLGAIVLLPSVSFAGENISGKTQDVQLNSTTIGDGNVTVKEVDQKIIDLQKSRRRGGNVSATNQSVNGSSLTVGHDNVDIQKAVQNAVSGQKSK